MPRRKPLLKPFDKETVDLLNDVARAVDKNLPIVRQDTMSDSDWDSVDTTKCILVDGVVGANELQDWVYSARIGDVAVALEYGGWTLLQVKRSTTHRLANKLDYWRFWIQAKLHLANR